MVVQKFILNKIILEYIILNTIISEYIIFIILLSFINMLHMINIYKYIFE